MLIHTKTHESPLTYTTAPLQRPREREKGKTPTPIHTKIHTSSRALWLIDRRVGLGFWGNENQIWKRVIFSEWVWGMGFWGNANQIEKRVIFSEWVWGMGFCGGVGWGSPWRLYSVEIGEIKEGREWFLVRRVDGWGGLDLGWSKIESWRLGHGWFLVSGESSRSERHRRESLAWVRRRKEKKNCLIKRCTDGVSDL